jgi:hypothetical protein
MGAPERGWIKAAERLRARGCLLAINLQETRAIEGVDDGNVLFEPLFVPCTNGTYHQRNCRIYGPNVQA